jgi:hypothetical protein
VFANRRSYAISRGVIIEPPSFLLNLQNAIVARFARRAAAT